MRRIILAFVVAPLAFPFLFFFIAGVFNRIPLRDAAGLVFLLPFAYAAEIALGLPGWIVFRRLRVRSIWAYAVAGALIGLVTVIFFGARELDPVSGGSVLAASCSAMLFRSICSV